MRRALTLIAALLAYVVAEAQQSDAALLRRASFDAPPAAADSLKAADRIAGALGRQLAGSCPFDPGHPAFFRQAVREAGAIPAVFFTADRLTRSGRVGTTQHHHFSEDGLIHEGVEAYLPDRRKKP